MEIKLVYKFRTSSRSFTIEKGRHNANNIKEDRGSVMCDQIDEEDEFHLLIKLLSVYNTTELQNLNFYCKLLQ